MRVTADLRANAPRRLSTAVAITLSLTAWVQPAQAFQANVSLGVRAGTLGFGAEVVAALDERVAVRAGAGFLGLDVDLTGRFGLAGNRTAELSLPTGLLSLGVEFAFAAGRLRAGETGRRGFPGGHAGLRPSGAPPRPQWGVGAGRR